MRKTLPLIFLLALLGVSPAEETVSKNADEAARMRLLLENPKNGSAYMQALRFLADSGDKTIIPKVIARINELLEELKKPEKPVETEKADKTKDKKAKSAMKSAQKDKDKEQDLIMDNIEELVGVLCDVKADTTEVKALLDVLFIEGRSEWRLGRIAIYAKGELKEKGFFKEFLWVLHEDSNYRYRREFIWACSKTGSKEIGPILTKLLPEESPAVRGIIAMTFWSFKARTYGFKLQDEAKYEQNLWVKEKYEWAGKKLSN